MVLYGQCSSNPLTLFCNAAATFPAISLDVCLVGLALPPILAGTGGGGGGGEGEEVGAGADLTSKTPLSRAFFFTLAEFRGGGQNQRANQTERRKQPLSPSGGTLTSLVTPLDTLPSVEKRVISGSE